MEVYLRLMFLKFRYRLSYETLCREVGDSIAAPAEPEAALGEGGGRSVDRGVADPDWGTLVMFAMTTGARRGEICGLR